MEKPGRPPPHLPQYPHQDVLSHKVHEAPSSLSFLLGFPASSQTPETAAQNPATYPPSYPVLTSLCLSFLISNMGTAAPPAAWT